MVHHRCRYAATRRDGQSRGFRSIADDAGDKGGDRSFCNGIKNRRHVGAATRDDDDQPLHVVPMSSDDDGSRRTGGAAFDTADEVRSFSHLG